MELLTFVETATFTKRLAALGLGHKGRIYLLFVYGKNESTTLTAEQKRTLRDLAAEIKRTA